MQASFIDLSLLLGCCVALFAGSSHGNERSVDASGKTRIEPESEIGPVDPILIEATMPNDAGEFTIGVTADYERLKDTKVARLPAVALNLGLTDFLDVEVEIPLVYNRAERTTFGLGDVATIFKWLVLEERKYRPAVVLGLETTVPTGSVRRELGEGNYELKPFVAGLKTFGAVVLQGNIGWSRVVASRSGEHEENILGGLSISTPLKARKLYVSAELSGSKVVNRRESIVAVAPGLTWFWSEEIFCAVAVPIPVSGDGPGVGIITRFEWGF